MHVLINYTNNKSIFSIRIQLRITRENMYQLDELLVEWPNKNGMIYSKER